MAPFKTFNAGTWNKASYSISIVSNSTITNVSFNQPAKTISFNVTGANGTMGFCRVAIPLSLMSGSWTVMVNGTKVLSPILNITTCGNYTYFYLVYHPSTETVRITSTIAIPEGRALAMPFEELLAYATIEAGAVIACLIVIYAITKHAKKEEKTTEEQRIKAEPGGLPFKTVRSAPFNRRCKGQERT